MTEFITTACAYLLHPRCDDLACMCECHFSDEPELQKPSWWEDGPVQPHEPTGEAVTPR